MNIPQQNRRTFLRHILTLGAAGMAGVAHTTLALAQAAGEALQGITGRIIQRTDPRYLSWWASMTWYIFKPKRYPDTIVRAASEADAIATIDYARSNGVRIAVRSTGHNPAKASVRDGGILLDLSQLRNVEIDEANRIAWIQPGIRAEELHAHTIAHGLVFPAAHTGIVGLGGYLLGGGLGWNMPEYGIACRSVLGAEIILADGTKVYASADENPELHWAIRGAGPGFFGAVVRYKLQLYPVHEIIKVRSYVIPAAKIGEALAELDAIGKVSDRRLEILIKIGNFHPVEKPYEARELVMTAQFFAFADSEEDAQRLMAPVASSGIAGLSVVAKEDFPIAYPELYLPPETDLTSPGRTTVENMWTDDVAEALRLLTDKLIADPPRSPRSFLLCGWSFNDTFEDPSSCVSTGGRHYMSWYMIAEQEEDIGPNYQWMDAAVELVRPFARSRYINEIDPARYPHHVEQCFAPADWQRLEALRKKYDPHGVFHTYLGRIPDERAA